MFMESRVDKYYSNDMPSREARNAKLYKVVSEQYDELNNLPLADNTDEIDMKKLKELIHHNDVEDRDREYSHSYNVIEQRKRNIDEQRVYDINKILEKAKYENNKLKDTSTLTKIDTSILSTLRSKETTYDDIKKIEKMREEELSSKFNKELDHDKDDLSMTRELKFKELSKEVDGNPLMDNVMDNNDLSLDLFDDLKPSGNTIITKPIREKDSEVSKVENTVKKDIDVHSGDTSDIDIIKNTDIKDKNDFFTSSYEFSANDFVDASDRESGAFRIVLLILAILIFAGVIAYFVIHFGIGV